ncbi:tubulin-tyrosine ligase family-domain-containing protein [Jimgerdemannia flammicorona]|uniref:Tubulin-tyrosine ligase family-domain-containing protein n=1 Tax=Jimgerdemannia flammicorona TaxID=994334 RepID=A0A433B9P2_9FUNG|nr:tubulin-tyrosine ligase family-domain-containing protein [Jimgerdemannia flammicorona]
MPAHHALVHMNEVYTHDLIVRSLRNHRWSVTELHAKGTNTDVIDDAKPLDLATFDPPVSLQWLEYELIDWLHLARQPTATLANSYCIRKGLIRKAQMAFNVTKYLTKRPESILGTAVPETWLFEIDHVDYMDEALNEVFDVVQDLEANEGVEDQAEKKLFIIKPSLANKAAGIHVFDSLYGLRSLFEKTRLDSDEEDEDGDGGEEERGIDGPLNGETAQGDEERDDHLDSDSEDGDISQIREWVIQRYISRPLLLRNRRKFHIRAYVLAVSNIRVYLYRDMLALFALNPYSVTDLHDKLAHLTNTCLQTDQTAFEEDESVRLFWDLEQKGLTGPELEGMFEQMKQILADTFDACAGEMTTFQAMPNAFELFGFDFLMDEDRKVYLLEANSFPDFKQTGARLKHVIDNLFNETLCVAVKPFFANDDEKDIPLDRFVKVFDRELLRTLHDLGST